MPVNEIHAPFYVKGKVASPVYPDGHAYRFYFATGTTMSDGLEGDEENWRPQFGGEDLGALSTIVYELFRRSSVFMPSGSTIKTIEVWQSIPDAPNVLVHVNPLPPAQPTFTGTPAASAYGMYVFATALRKVFKWTTFDGGSPAPQKSPFPALPIEDNDTIGWYVLRGDIPFANNDGLRLTTGVSLNTGYNRKLARTYGRTIAP